VRLNVAVKPQVKDDYWSSGYELQDGFFLSEGYRLKGTSKVWRDVLLFLHLDNQILAFKSEANISCPCIFRTDDHEYLNTSFPKEVSINVIPK
jgi:hypothetical protein